MTKISVRMALATALGAGLLASATVALADDPLGGKSPWNFQPQNRAAIAVAIKAAEDGNNANGVAGGGGTTVLCGGTSGAQGDSAVGAGASATANSSCVIITDSEGAIVNVGQESVGDQTSEAKTKSSSSTTNNNEKSGGSIDEVAAILGGPKN